MISSKSRGETRVTGAELGKIFLVIALFAGVMMIPYLHGHWRLADDAYVDQLQRYRLQERVLLQGKEWIQWILNIQLGQPAGLAVGATWFYPFQVLWGVCVGWSELSYVWYMLLHLIAGGWVGALLCLQLGLSIPATLFAVFAYIGNGYVLGTLSNWNIMIPMFLWPIAISGLIDLHTEGKSVARATLKVALGAYLLEIVSYPVHRILIFIITLIGYWISVREPGTWFKGIKWKPLAVAGVAGVLAAAPELVSTLLSTSLSNRFHKNDVYDEYTYNSPTNFLVLATAFLPGVFVARDGAKQLGMLWLERTWWIGSLTIGVILAALRTRTLSLKKYAFAGVVALLALLFSMGGHSFVREASSVMIPPLEHLRHSDYARFIVVMFAAFLGGLSLDALAEGEPAFDEEKGRKRSSLYWALFFGLAIYVAVTENSSLMWVEAKDLYPHPTAGWKIVGLHSLFYLLLAYTFCVRRSVIGKKWNWVWLAVALQFLSMQDGSYAHRRLIAQEEQVHPAETFTMASPHPNVRSTRGWNQGDDWLKWDGNTPALYTAEFPYHYQFWPAVNDRKASNFLSTLVSCHDDALDAVGSRIDGLSCQGLQFQIDRYFGNTIEISGSGPKPALIHVHDLYDPGWSAEVNGQPASVMKAFGYFKAVEVPAGSWKVKLTYAFPHLKEAWFACAAGFLLMILIAMGRIPWASGVVGELEAPASSGRAAPKRRRAKRRV